MSKAIKAIVAEAFKKRYEGVVDACVVDITGLSVQTQEHIRSVLRKQSARLQVVKHSMARRIAALADVEILHIGDHDPSGVHLYYNLGEDLQAFVDHYGGQMSLTRLAVTPAQVSEMDLPTAPPKRTDNRSFEGETTQAEAIPPRVLREIVTDAVEARIDMDAYNATLAEEEVIRERLVERLQGI